MTDPAALLERLVGFPTVSRDSNMELIRYVAGYLQELGVESRIVEDATGRKANLYAVIGPADVPGVMLSGHTDVVPVEGQPWSTDPFALARRDGAFFGRGAADMKGFIACVLAWAPEAARRGLRRPIHIALSHDEEIGCVGVRRLLDMLEGMAVRPFCCIVGEPTLMQVIIGHKGKLAGRIRATGHEAHSSLLPTGLNAIHLAADMLPELRAIESEIEERGTHDHHYVVPHTTVHVGTIRGGTALNIVPRECIMDFEIRHLPQDDPDRLMERIRARAASLTAEAARRFPETGVAVEVVNAYPALDTTPEDEVVAFVTSLTGKNSLGRVDFGTEGGLYKKRLGIPTVVCGPGSIEQAHKPDEFIAESQLAECTAFLRRLLERLAA